MPATKTSIPSIGKSKFISLPISELKTIYAPVGKEMIINPKITDVSAEYGVERALKSLSICKSANVLRSYPRGILTLPKFP